MTETLPIVSPSILTRSAESAGRWTWLDWLLLAAVFGVALWIRLTHVDASLSFDELWHLASTQGIGSAMAYYHHDVIYHDAIRLTSLEHEQNLWHVWNGMDGILHPPLFIVALRLWREVFGPSDLAAHGYSIFCGLIAIGFTFDSARLAMNRAAAMLAALSLACAQTQVYFSQEVRAYAMLTALGAIALWLMTRIELLGPTRRRVTALGLMTLPLMLTHYFAFGACLVIGVYGLIAGGKHRKRFLLSVVASATIYAAIWLPFAIEQLDDLSTGDAFLVMHKGPMHILLLAASAPFRLIAERDYQLERTPLLSGVLFVVPWFLIRKLHVLRPWAIWLCVSILPMVLLDLTRGTVHVAYIRYLAIATPAVPLLFIGTAWAVRQFKLAYGLGAVLTFVGAIYLISDNRVLLDADDLSDATRIIEPRFRPGDAILTYSGKAPAFYCDALALTLSHSPKLFPCTLAVLSRPMSRQEVEALGTKSLWLVSGTLEMPVETLIPGARIDYSRVATRIVDVMHITIDDVATQPATPAVPDAQRNVDAAKSVD